MARKKIEVVAAGTIMVGTMLWFYDESVHRVDDDGTYRGRGDWVRHRVEGETTKSWLLGFEYASGWQYKVSKKDLTEARRHGFSKTQWYTEESKEEKLWDGENRYLVRAATERCSIAKLKRIKAIIDELEEI